MVELEQNGGKTAQSADSSPTFSEQSAAVCHSHELTSRNSVTGLTLGVVVGPLDIHQLGGGCTTITRG